MLLVAEKQSVSKGFFNLRKYLLFSNVVFVDAIPLGGTGKMQKVKLRESLTDYVLPDLR